MNNQMIGKPIEVLLVEDNPGDVRLTQEAFKEGRVQNQLNVVNDGEEALSYLRQEGDYADVTCPDLILLDLNMPGMGGKDFLKEIKSNEQFCDIPVVIVSTSDAPGDIEDGYRLQAAGYVQKRLDPKELRRVIEKLANYWFVTSCLVKDKESLVCDNV